MPASEPGEKKPQPPPAAGLQQHGTAASQPDSRQTAVAEAALLSREPAVTVSLDAIKESWHEVVQNMSKVKIFMANYLKEGMPSKIQNSLLYVTFHKNHSLYKETLEKKENREMVEKAIAETLHEPLKVHFVLSQEEKAHDGAVDHPVVQSALDMFNARLIREG